jgi:hypothetical protein
MLIDLNEVEKEALAILLKGTKQAFDQAKYNTVTEGYNGSFCCQMPTKHHIKSLEAIRKKIEHI